MPIYVRRLAFLGSRLAAARSMGTSHEQLCASPQENAIHNGLIPLESQELRAGVTCRRGASGGRSAGDAKPAADRSGQSARRSRQSAVGVRPASTSAALVRRRGSREASKCRRSKASPACNAGKVPHVFWVMVPYATDHGERLAVVASAAPHECRRITHDAFRLQMLSGELPCDHGNDRHRVIHPASAARYFTTFGSGGEHACARPYEMRAVIARSRTLYERRQMRSQAHVWSAAVAGAHQVAQRVRRSLPGALARRAAFTRGSLREERLILELSRHQFTWLHNTLCGAGRLRCRGIADVAKQRQ